MTTTDPVTKLEIKPCPFCGGEAKVEEYPGASVDPNSVAFSVGCVTDADGRCYGYMSYTSFSRRSDAIHAWNKRAQDGEV